MINKIISTMRKNAKLTQKELAKKCNIATTTLSGYEINHREPNFETIEKIANMCNYEILFKNKENGDILTTKNISRKEL